MKHPTALILVSGPPAAGKTTLSRLLSQEFALPLIAKDAIKERLADSLGLDDLAWSRRLGRASIELLWDAVEVQLRVGRSLMAESAFFAEPDTERLAALASRYAFTPFQVHCMAPADLLWQRFDRRDRSGDRHTCHLHLIPQEEFIVCVLNGTWGPLRFGGTTLTLDTTDWAAVDLAPVRSALRELLRAGEAT